MKLVTNGTYDERQQLLALEILRAVKEALERVEAPPELVKQLTGDIGFSITAILDDSRSINYGESKTLSPLVTFILNREELEFAGGNSWMHEYVYRLLPTLFPDEET